jgi:hypothetical protein
MFKLYTLINTTVFTNTLILIATLISVSNLQAQNGSSFRTETQDKWGAVPKGNNSAAYMHRKFEAAFPNGITVGCTNNIDSLLQMPLLIFYLQMGFQQYYLLELKLTPELHSAIS